MIRGHKATFNGIDLNSLGTVEVADFDRLSINLEYYERAEAVNKLAAVYHKNKAGIIGLRIYRKKRDIREIEKECEKIIGLLHTKENTFFSIDNKLGYGLITNAKYTSSHLWGYIEFEVINELGVWLAQEKTQSLPAAINVGGIADTKDFYIEITPAQNNIKITNNSKAINLLNVYDLNNKIIIDFRNKVAKQNGQHVELSLDSMFFDLNLGSNTITIEGGSGQIKWNEVVSL